MVTQEGQDEDFAAMLAESFGQDNVKEGEILGFACHDATTKAFFGPTGVLESARGQGIGEAMLIATLRGMREAGYGYAIIGAAGPVAFYQKRLDAIEIPKSKPGVYAGMLRGKS